MWAINMASLRDCKDLEQFPRGAGLHFPLFPQLQIFQRLFEFGNQLRLGGRNQLRLGVRQVF